MSRSHASAAADGLGFIASLSTPSSLSLTPLLTPPVPNSLKIKMKETLCQCVNTLSERICTLLFFSCRTLPIRVAMYSVIRFMSLLTAHFACRCAVWRVAGSKQHTLGFVIATAHTLSLQCRKV